MAKDDKIQPIFLLTHEAAELLRMSPRTLESHRLNKTGPKFYKAGPGRGAKVLYTREDLKAWLDKHSGNEPR